MDEWIGAILGALLEALGDFAVEAFFALIAELLWDAGPKVKRRAHAVFLIVVGGVGAVLLSSLLFPHRIIRAGVAIPGVSLILAPIAVGVIMQVWGKWRRQAGRYTGQLATFEGGAMFGFVMALMRWWLVSRSV